MIPTSIPYISILLLTSADEKEVTNHAPSRHNSDTPKNKNLTFKLVILPMYSKNKGFNQNHAMLYNKGGEQLQKLLNVYAILMCSRLAD